MGTAGDGARGGGEAIIREARVTPYDYHLGLAESLGRHQGMARLGQRAAEQLGPDDQHPGRPPARVDHLPEDLERGEYLGERGLHAQPLELGLHGGGAGRRVVGEKGHTAALFAEEGQHLGGSRHEHVPGPHTAVEVEHEAAQRAQLTTREPHGHLPGGY